MDSELDWKLDELLGSGVSHTKFTSGVCRGLILGPIQCCIFILHLHYWPGKCAPSEALQLRGVPGTQMVVLPFGLASEDGKMKRGMWVVMESKNSLGWKGPLEVISTPPSPSMKGHLDHVQMVHIPHVGFCKHLLYAAIKAEMMGSMEAWSDLICTYLHPLTEYSLIS